MVGSRDVKGLAAMTANTTGASLRYTRRSFVLWATALGGCTYILVKKASKGAAVFVPQNSEAEFSEVLKSFADSNHFEFSAWRDIGGSQTYELKSDDISLSLAHSPSPNSQEYNVALYNNDNTPSSETQIDQVWGEFKQKLLSVKGVERWEEQSLDTDGK